jgi:hypothetical protein
MLNIDVDHAVERLVECIKDLSMRLEIISLEERIEQLELIQMGTLIIEDMLGYQIGDWK